MCIWRNNEKQIIYQHISEIFSGLISTFNYINLYRLEIWLWSFWVRRELKQLLRSLDQDWLRSGSLNRLVFSIKRGVYLCFKSWVIFRCFFWISPARCLKFSNHTFSGSHLSNCSKVIMVFNISHQLFLHQVKWTICCDFRQQSCIWMWTWSRMQLTCSLPLRNGTRPSEWQRSWNQGS